MQIVVIIELCSCVFVLHGTRIVVEVVFLFFFFFFFFCACSTELTAEWKDNTVKGIVGYADSEDIVAFGIITVRAPDASRYGRGAPANFLKPLTRRALDPTQQRTGAATNGRFATSATAWPRSTKKNIVKIKQCSITN